MAHLISKAALVAEIERRKEKCDTFYDIALSNNAELAKVAIEEQKRQYNSLLSFINNLEMKDIEDLQGLEKEVAEDYVGLVNKKRVPIELKGELKAKFKNEFNTLWQTVNGIDFANVARPIIERICLNFATWGFYNLSKIGDIKGNKEIDSIEVKGEDLK